MNYNLLVERWIPVLGTDGRMSRVGIKEALMQAGRIRQIAASNPMDRLAILRFLLALLYWCKGNPPPDSEFASGDSLSADWFSKLDEYRECFNLLGEGKRFYQDRAAQRPRATTDLLQEIPTGNNFWHSRHSTDEVDGLCPACCVFGLLRLPLFSVSGLPDLKAGINGTPPVYVLPWGKSLLETLLANWTPYPALGEPAWIRPDIRPVSGQDVPLLTGLTLLSRRVWLYDPDSSGVCIGCGAETKALIRKCEFQSAGNQKNDYWIDPHVVYLDDTPRRALRAADLTAAGKFRMDRPWPDLLARSIEMGKIGTGVKSISLHFVGFATDKAKNIDVWERTIDVSTGQSIQDSAASSTRQWQNEGKRLERRLTRSKVQGAAAIAAVRPQVEDRVSAKAIDLISGDDDAWEKAAAEYRPLMQAIAGALSPGFTSAAAYRRKQILNAAPDMRLRKDSAEKPDRKKGGDD